MFKQSNITVSVAPQYNYANAKYGVNERSSIQGGACGMVEVSPNVPLWMGNQLK